MTTILTAYDEPRLAEVRGLFAEYAAAFDHHICFEGFQNELAGLPGVYVPPSGCLLLAEHDGRAAGCVALRRLDDDAYEMKRLYVRPAFRGLAIGRTLVEAVLAQASALGYRRMRLDTLPAMERARALYASLGFRRTEAYYDNPAEGVRKNPRRLAAGSVNNSNLFVYDEAAHWDIPQHTSIHECFRVVHL